MFAALIGVVGCLSCCQCWGEWPRGGMCLPEQCVNLGVVVCGSCGVGS